MTKIHFPQFGGPDVNPFDMRQLVQALELRFDVIESQNEENTLNQTTDSDLDSRYAQLSHTHTVSEITDFFDNVPSSAFDLSDINGSPSPGDSLIWDGVQFLPGSSGTSLSLNDLTDVSTPAPLDEQLLRWSETLGQWEAVTADLTSSLVDLTDTDMTGQATGDLIFNSGANTWRPTGSNFQWVNGQYIQLGAEIGINWFNDSLASVEMLAFGTSGTGASTETRIGVDFAGNSGSRMSVADATEFDIASNLYTIEFDVFLDQTATAKGNNLTLIDKRVDGPQFGWTCTINEGSDEISFAGWASGNATPVISIASTMTDFAANQLYRIAIVRDTGGVWSLYVDNERVATGTETGPIGANTSEVRFGVSNNTSDGNRPLDGKLDNIRLTEGVARYSGATITQDEAPFPTNVMGDPNYNSVELLTDCNGTVGQTTLTDQGPVGRAITLTGSSLQEYDVDVPSTLQETFIVGDPAYLTQIDGGILAETPTADTTTPILTLATETDNADRRLINFWENNVDGFFLQADYSPFTPSNRLVFGSDKPSGDAEILALNENGGFAFDSGNFTYTAVGLNTGTLDMPGVGTVQVGDGTTAQPVRLDLLPGTGVDATIGLFEDSDLNPGNDYGFSVVYAGDVNQFEIKAHNNNTAGVDVITIPRDASVVNFLSPIDITVDTGETAITIDGDNGSTTEPLISIVNQNTGFSTNRRFLELFEDTVTGWTIDWAAGAFEANELIIGNTYAGNSITPNIRIGADGETGFGQAGAEIRLIGLSTTSDRGIVVDTDGDAFLILNADANNAGEDDVAYIKYTQDGTLTQGYVGYTGNIGQLGDGTTLANAPINSLVVLNKLLSGSAATENALVLASKGVVQQVFDGEAIKMYDDVRFYGPDRTSYAAWSHDNTTLSSSFTSTVDWDILGLTGEMFVDTDLRVSGNLQVDGTTTTINSTTVSIADNIITLNSDEVGVPTENAGIEIERGTSANVFVRWNETSDRWEFTNDGTNYSNLLADGVTTNAMLRWDGSNWVEEDEGLLLTGGQIRANQIGGLLNTENFLIYGGPGADGANIELYASVHPSEASRAYYDAARHSFRSVAGTPTQMTIDSNQILMNVELDVNVIDVTTGNLEFQFNGVQKAIFNSGASTFDLRDGYDLRIYDSTDADILLLLHDGNNAVIRTGGTDGNDIFMQPESSTAAVFGVTLNQMNKPTRFYDSGGTDYAEFNHDGTDFNTTFVNTVDWNLTGANLKSFKSGIRAAAAFQIEAGQAGMYFSATGANVDEKNWTMDALDSTGDGYFRISTATDVDGFGIEAFRINRSGTSPTQLVARNYTFNIDQTVGAAQDNYVLTYDNASGEIQLEAATGGGGGNIANGTVTNAMARWDGVSSWVEETSALLDASGNMSTTGDFSLLAGGALLIQDSTNSDRVQFNHDGTDFNLSYPLGTTTAWNISGAQYTKFVSDGTAFGASNAEGDLGPLVISNEGLTAGSGVVGQGIDFLKLASGTQKKAAITPRQAGADEDSIGLRFWISQSSVSADPILPILDLVNWETRMLSQSGLDYLALQADGTDTAINSQGATTFRWRFDGSTKMEMTAAQISSLVRFDIRSGNVFRIYDTDNSHFVQFQHDGTDLNLTGSGPTSTINWYSGATEGNLNIGRSATERLKIEVGDGDTRITLDQDELDTTPHRMIFDIESANTGERGFAFSDNGATIFEIGHSFDEVRVRDGYEFRIYDTTDNDFASFQHSGTNFLTQFTQTNDWIISGLDDSVVFDVPLRFNDSDPHFTTSLANSGSTTSTWYKICDFSIASGTFNGVGFRVTITNHGNNYGAGTSSTVVDTFHANYVRSGAVEGDTDAATVRGTNGNIRIVRTALGVGELQWLPSVANRTYTIDVEVDAGTSDPDVTLTWYSAETTTAGSTVGTIVTATPDSAGAQFRMIGDLYGYGEVRALATDGTDYIQMSHQVGFGLITATDNIYLQPNGVNALEVTSSGTRVMQGDFLRIDGPTGLSAYVDFQHDDTNLNITGTATSLINVNTPINSTASTSPIRLNSVATGNLSIDFANTAGIRKVTNQGGWIGFADSSLLLHAGDNEAGIVSDLGIVAGTTDENMYLTADGNVRMIVNRQGSYATSYSMQFTSDGSLRFYTQGAPGANYFSERITSTQMQFDLVGTVDSLQLNAPDGGDALRIRDSGGAGTAANPWISFRDSAQTRLGYVGMGSVSDSILRVVSDTDAVELRHADSAAIRTDATGGEVWDTSGSNPTLGFYNDAGTLQSNITFESNVLRATGGVTSGYGVDNTDGLWGRNFADTTDYALIRILSDDAVRVGGTTGSNKVELCNITVVEAETQDSNASTNTSGLLIRDHDQTLRDAGFNDLPEKDSDTSFTLNDEHAGTGYSKTNGTARTITLPSATTFPIGSTMTIYNEFTSGNITVNASTNTRTLYWLDGSTRTGGASTNRTVGPGGVATIRRRTSTIYTIVGSGIS